MMLAPWIAPWIPARPIALSGATCLFTTETTILTPANLRLGFGHLLAQGLKVQNLPFKEIDHRDLSWQPFANSRTRGFTHEFPVHLRRRPETNVGRNRAVDIYIDQRHRQICAACRR